MRRLADQYSVHYIQLTDNAIPVNMLKALAENTQDMQGINWFGFVRFEKALEDRAFVHPRWPPVAVVCCSWGWNRGHKQFSTVLKKGIKLASVVKVLDNLAAAGIATFVYIMLGTPGETQADAEQTLHFLEKHAGKIGFLNISIMNMPRASGLLDNPEHYGIDDTDSVASETPLALYQRFNSNSNWNRATARRFLKSAPARFKPDP